MAAASAVIASILVTGSHDAKACGGYFAPQRPNEITVVTDHRMAFSISSNQTVLWDQIRYSGNPSEFAWVLPIHAGARIELSHDEWFAALDATTAPVIVAPTIPASPSSGGIGCGSASADNESFAPGDHSVDVIHQEVVGPYEAVTLRSTDGNALETWLVSHGYAIPDSIRPTIAAYTSEGFDFIALRLLPGQGIQAMKPVRVITEGASFSLPLRMIAAGAGANVGLTLYVISEGRYHPQNFPDVTVDDNLLYWDNGQNRSNYQELSLAAMATNDGRGWLTEYAQPPVLTGSSSSYPSGYYAPSSVSLDSAYFSSCAAGLGRGGSGNGNLLPDASATNGGDPVEAGNDDASDARSDGAAGDASTRDAATGDDGARDASVPPSGDGTCKSHVDEGVCCDFDDLELAMGTLRGPWVTRLRANLPIDALAAGDLRLEATAIQAASTNVHYALDPQTHTRVAPGASSGCTTAPAGSRYGSLVTIGGALLGIAALLRRRR